MSLPLPAQTDPKPAFSLHALKSRAGARFAILGLTVAGVLYYLAAPESYRPELAWPRERPFGSAPPSTWDPDFDAPPPPPHEPGMPVKPSGDPVMAERAEAVRKAFRHAYTGYTNVAWNRDELLPTSNGSTNKYIYPVLVSSRC
jgi:mannosyl-oligosaccharide alpha-1,2-mannosidase